MNRPNDQQCLAKPIDMREPKEAVRDWLDVLLLAAVQIPIGLMVNFKMPPFLGASQKKINIIGHN